ncbi:polysaccharide biosynthesis tyrosine autokinase [Mycobacterium hodleri]|uniref:non-specific protein-tyrosine kinase n=1 Tax=Mycolicibacterium hodleri TaxID=49897 RepID=A0A544VZL1_9MYCO|nr:polysaccharide biosynthesis tyrosine autokinase [Mycolicibacterium hodleri]
MNFRGFTKALRTRWLIVCTTTIVAVLAAVATTLLTTPLYQSTTRLFVSSSAGGKSLADKYSGTLDSQQRVLSYTELITGETLAQRTIDKLNLDMTAQDLAAEVTASAKLDTVLIDVAVTDRSPVRARDIANALSDEFVNMVRELETPEDGSPPAARVVVEQRASLAEFPISPNKPRNIALGLAIGLLLGVGLALLRNYLDNSVKDQETLFELSGVGLVGAVPLDKERRTRPAISFDHDSSSIAEAFRRIRTNLQFLAVDNPPRVIVVASSLPSEGKSTTAINIALALAEAEHSVVLVDGDMRRPMLDKYLNVVGTVGFSTVLSGGASLSEVLQKTTFPGLTVLTSGPTPPNPSELIGSLAAQKVLGELRAQFDYVIVDSSPLLAVTDATILATSADGVLLIARYGQTKREQLSQAIRNLKDVGVSPLGTVFTMTPARGDGSYSYNYYGYGYGRDVAQQSDVDTSDSQQGGRRRAVSKNRQKSN